MESSLMRELSALLKAMFSVEDLRRWVTLTFGRAVADDLPGSGVSLAQLSFDVVLALERHGLVGQTLFDALIAERPGRRDEILAVARGMGASAGTGTRPGAGARAGAAGATTAPGARADLDPADPAQAGPVVRVLHLSDFHFRARTSWDASTVLGRLVDDIAALARDGLAPDLVVLTGDVAHGGKAEEYALARQWIEGALLPAARVDVKRLVIAPGNHDVDRSLVSKGAQHIAEGIRGSRDEQHVTEVMEGEDGRLVLRRLDGFVKFMNELGAAGAPLTRPWHRTVHEIRGVRVHCAALASAWSSADDGDHGKLLLGLWQCNEVLREAERADVVIAALHHPWSYVAEWDLAACQAEIERSAGLVLRGHLHDARHDHRQSPRHDGVLELAAGASYESSEYPNSYHLIEIRPDAPAARRARVHPRFWDRTRRAWRPDLNVFGGPWGDLPLRVRSAAGNVPRAAGG
jgi:hypothetical protein